MREILSILASCLIISLILTGCVVETPPLTLTPSEEEQSTAELAPDDGEALIARAIDSAWAGDFAQAENDFNTAYSISYERHMTADAYVAWGIAITAQRSTSYSLFEAESLFDSAMSGDSNNPDAYTARAFMYLKAAYDEGIEYESTGAMYLRKAISDFEKAIGLDPDGIQGRTKRFDFEDDMAFLPNYIEACNRNGALLVSAYYNYSDALEAYENVLEVYPENVEALIGRGNAYMGLQQYDLAFYDFNKAIELTSDNAHAYAGRAIAYTKDEQYNLAITDFTKAIELDDGYANGRYSDAYASPEYGWYTATNEIAFAPAYIDAYTSRGYACLEDGEYDLAIDNFSKAVAFQPDCSDAFHEVDSSAAYAGRGIANARSGAYGQALDDFTIANYGEWFWMSAQHYVGRAIAYAGAGHWEMASRDFAEAETYASWVTYMDATAYVIRGGAYLSDIGSGWKDRYWDICMGNDVIQRSFGKAIELESNNAEAYIGRGITNEIADENDKAVDDFRIALEIAPGEFEGHAEKYLALIGRDLPTHSFNAAIALDSNNAEAYLGRALCYVSDGFIIETDSKYSWDLHDLVFADFDMALKLDPNLTGVYIARASFYTARASLHGEMSDFEKAMADLERVIESDPTDEESQEALDLIEELQETLALW